MHKSSKKSTVATALKYDASMPAPLVVFNGRCNVADSMLDVAKNLNIPIVYENDVAEVLAACQIGDYVPQSTWIILAKIFAFVRGQLETTTSN